VATATLQTQRQLNRDLPWPAQTILSFDVEEHYRIEAAARLRLHPEQRTHYDARVEPATYWILEQLAAADVLATFFIVGQIAETHPALVRAIHEAGHEVASHGWDHRRVLTMTPATFREDIRRSVDALAQVTGHAVLGYRAPTFSILPQTRWALDVLAEEGMAYDSSIYPVRHDRYGVPQAPRFPFLARGAQHTILELPPATLRLLSLQLAMGGGGHFRLWPLCFTEWAMRQSHQQFRPPVAMLYFHPWEFDPEQERLPLGRLSRFRTYVGIRRTRGRLQALLQKYSFARAIDVAERLDALRHLLPCYTLPESASAEQPQASGPVGDANSADEGGRRWRRDAAGVNTERQAHHPVITAPTAGAALERRIS
jgi:polysaccharide deacetylase family protein (PEP-CTERM system associated)